MEEVAALAPSLPEVISSLTGDKPTSESMEAPSNGAGQGVSATVETTSAGSSTAKPTKKGKKSKKTDPAQLPSTSFSPSLPASLPVPSSPNTSAQSTDDKTTETEIFNSNHKRPAPTEFNLDNKGVVTPPSKGVKFEDGLSPGQGKDGETVIPGVGRYTKEELEVVKKNLGEMAEVVQGKKKSNAVERTVWTLIMITFFLGKSGLPLRCALIETWRANLDVLRLSCCAQSSSPSDHHI